MERLLLLVAFVGTAACATEHGGQTGDEGNLVADGGTGGGSSSAGSNGLRFPLSESNEVIIHPSFHGCEVDADCVIVETSCADCCGRAAIRAGLLSEYEAAFTASCEDYSGPVCRCIPPNVVPRCLDQQCEPVLQE